MSIRIRCKCGQSYRVKEQLAGRKVRCKKCSAVVVVPDQIIPDQVVVAAGPERQTSEDRSLLSDPDNIRKKRIEYAAAGATERQDGLLVRLIRRVEKFVPFPLLGEQDQFEVQAEGEDHPPVQMTVSAIRELLLTGDIVLATRIRHPDWEQETDSTEVVWKTIRDIVAEHYQLEVLYRPVLAHIRRGAKWLAIAAVVVMFPLVLLLVLMMSLLAETDDDSVVRFVLMLLFAPLFMPLFIYVAGGMAVCGVSGALYGGVVGLVRSPFLPRAHEKLD